MGLFTKGRIWLSADRGSWLEKTDAHKFSVVINGTEVLAHSTIASASQASPARTALSAIATTVFSAAATGMWAFSSSTAAKLYRTRINQLIVDMGAMKTAFDAVRAALIANKTIKGSA